MAAFGAFCNRSARTAVGRRPPDLASDAYATGQALYTLHELGVPVKDAGVPPRGAVSLADPGGRRELVREEPGGEVPALLRDQLPVRSRSVDLVRRYRLGGHGAELRQRSAAGGAAVDRLQAGRVFRPARRPFRSPRFPPADPPQGSKYTPLLYTSGMSFPDSMGGWCCHEGLPRYSCV